MKRIQLSIVQVKKQKCTELASKLEFKSSCMQLKPKLLFTILVCEHELHWLRQEERRQKKKEMDRQTG